MGIGHGVTAGAAGDGGKQAWQTCGEVGEESFVDSGKADEVIRHDAGSNGI